MPHPLTRKIVALRRRVRRLAAVHALSVAVVAWLVAVLVLGAADYWLRFEDRGLRLVASLAAMAVAGWSLWYAARSVAAARLGDGELARHVERCFPALRDRLLSAVEFLRQADNDPTAGSARLRRELIARVTADTREVEFAAVLDRRPALRAVAALAAGLLLAGVLTASAPAVARIALARLANPFGRTAWPRATRPPVVAPPAVASLSVRLFPPGYTGLPPAAGERHLRGLAGTGIEIDGESTRPLSSARIVVEGAAAIPAEITAAGRHFHIAPSRWRIEKSGFYRVELTDRDGIRGGGDERWPIDALAERAARGGHRAAGGRFVRCPTRRRSPSHIGQR